MDADQFLMGFIIGAVTIVLVAICLGVAVFCAVMVNAPLMDDDGNIIEERRR